MPTADEGLDEIKGRFLQVVEDEHGEPFPPIRMFKTQWQHLQRAIKEWACNQRGCERPTISVITARDMVGIPSRRKLVEGPCIHCGKEGT